MYILMNMKKLFIILFAALCATTSMAQQARPQTAIEDKELSFLVDVVRMLRTSSMANYNKALEKLKGDRQWTQMDETNVERPGRCLVGRDASFRLNVIMKKVDEARQYVATQGNMLNGEDERYNYSLFELAVEAGKSVSFVLKKRSGRQTFVVVPFHKKDAKLEASVSLRHTQTTQADGTIVFHCEGTDLGADGAMAITITNRSGKDQAFVLLNHNSRKQ